MASGGELTVTVVLAAMGAFPLLPSHQSCLGLPKQGIGPVATPSPSTCHGLLFPTKPTPPMLITVCSPPSSHDNVPTQGLQPHSPRGLVVSLCTQTASLLLTVYFADTLLPASPKLEFPLSTCTPRAPAAKASCSLLRIPLGVFPAPQEQGFQIFVTLQSFLNLYKPK